MSVVNQSVAETASGPKLKERLRIVFAVGGLYTEASGVGRIVCDLANALAENGNPVDVYTAVCGGKEPAAHMLDSPNRLFADPGHWMARLSSSPRLKRRLQDDLKDVDVVHNHSVWMLPNHYASKIAFQYRKPVVFTAHGVLEPWALARSRWKKRIAGVCFQNRDLRRSACIHVNSEAEVKGIRDYGLTNPIAIIPNGVDITAFDELPEKDAFSESYPETAGKKLCLFLSRLHEKKGLGHLIQAWSRLANEHPDWHLVIAGPDDGYEAPLRKAISDLGLSRSVTLTGPLYGASKANALAAADAFVLPSYSEGFSMAILEAMACRLPVLITEGCNFPEVAQGEAGFIVLPTVEETEKGIRALLSLSDTDRNSMGSHGRRMIEQRYTWRRVAEQTAELYRWMVGGGSAPETLIR